MLLILQKLNFMRIKPQCQDKNLINISNSASDMSVYRKPHVTDFQASRNEKEKSETVGTKRNQSWAEVAKASLEVLHSMARVSFSHSTLLSDLCSPPRALRSNCLNELILVHSKRDLTYTLALNGSTDVPACVIPNDVAPTTGQVDAARPPICHLGRPHL